MRKLLRWLFTTSLVSADVGLLVMRLSVGLLLAFAHGADKVRNLDAFVAQVDKLNMPSAQFLGICAALAEFLGGLLLAIGLCSRGAAVAVLVTMGVAAFRVHGGDPFAKQELAIVYGIGALALVLAGPGRISLDHLFFGREKNVAPTPTETETAGKSSGVPKVASTTDWLGSGAIHAPVPPPTPSKKTKDTVVARPPKLPKP